MNCNGAVNIFTPRNVGLQQKAIYSQELTQIERVFKTQKAERSHQIRFNGLQRKNKGGKVVRSLLKIYPPWHLEGQYL
jgi:hypothetical protein